MDVRREASRLRCEIHRRCFNGEVDLTHGAIASLYDDPASPLHHQSLLLPLSFLPLVEGAAIAAAQRHEIWRDLCENITHMHAAYGVDSGDAAAALCAIDKIWQECMSIEDADKHLRDALRNTSLERVHMARHTAGFKRSLPQP